MMPELTIGSVSLPTFLLIWMFIFALSAYSLRRSLGNIGVDEDNAYWVILVIMVFGAFGAKLFDMVKYAAAYPQFSLAEVYSRTGLGSYGLVIAGFGSVILALRLAQLPVLKILDALAPLMVIAIAGGRLGCFLAGDGCYGPPTELPWGIAFPHGTVPTIQRVHPTPVYEILALIPVYLIIKRVGSQRNQPEGFLFTLAFFLTNGVRIVMEFWRSAMYSPRVAGMTIEQIMAILFTVGSGLLLLKFKQSMSKLQV